MKLKRLLSLLLVMAMLLTNLPAGILTVRAEDSALDYTKGYTWNFDQNTTLGATKGLVAGNATGTVQIMNHEGNNSLTPNRAIANGVLTTTVAKNWGNTVGHAVFYKLPADLTAGETYQLSMNLYGGNDAAAMNGITVSFGSYESTITGAGGTIQKWQYATMDALHTEAKINFTLTDNLATPADSCVVIEFEATEAIAAQAKANNWVLVTFPMAVNGSYCLGTVTLKEQSAEVPPVTTAPVITTVPETTVPETTVPETTVPETTVPETTVPETTVPETTVPAAPSVDYAAGYDWIFDKTIESFGKDASFKTLMYGNEAQTLAFVNHEGMAASSTWGFRTLVGGLLSTRLAASWAKEDAGMGIYYKLPADLKVGQEYILSLNIYALSEGTVLSNGKADSLKVSFNAEPKTTQAWQIAAINGYHNSTEGTYFTVAGPEELSTDAANRFEIVFTATQAMVDAGDWILISIPLPFDKEVVLGTTTLKEKLPFGNELVNGNFDQGETGWGKNGNFTAGSVIDGVLVLPTTKTNGDAIFFQSMNLAPGTYQLSFDGKGTANKYRPLLYIGINQWSKVYGEHFLNNFGFGEDWKTAVITFTVPESAADADTGLAPVFISLWSSNGSYAPETEMQLDNFEVRKCFSATVLNADGQTAGGLKEFVLPNAANGAPFDLTLEPLDTNYAMTVTATMGGKNVPVVVNADGSVTIHIDEVSGNVAIVADSVKTSYSISTDDGLNNSSTVVEVEHGEAYSAQITCGREGMKLYSVFYTMGTETVAVPVIDGVATISIESVTGDVTISAILVDASIIAQWIFDADKVIDGNSEWGNADKTISIANSTYNDGAGRIDRVVKPGCLTITSLCPPNNWSDAGSIVGFKLPSDLAVGKTYMLNLPLYAGNGNTTMVSSRPGSTLNGLDLIFTTSQPANMWAQTDSKRLYADGVGILVSNSQSVGVLSQDANNVFCISFTVTEEIAAYAKANNWLSIFINHPHTGGVYNLGNVTMNEVTKPAAVSKDTGDSVCDGSAIAQIGKPYFAQIAPKAGFKVVSASYTMGGKTVELEVVNGCAYVSIPEVTGDITIKAVTEQLEPGNLLVNGTFILGTQFWSYENGSFVLMENGGSDKLDIPAHLQAAGMAGGLLSQAFKVEKNTNYQLTFRYKGNVPVDAALWAIASNQSFAWNSVIYKGSVKNAEDWTEVTVVFDSGNRSDLYLLFRTEADSDYALDNIWVTKTDKAVTVDPYQRPILGSRPNPNPFNDYPYITDDSHNLMPDFGFETDTPVLENGFSQVEKTDDAWEGSNALHYATIITGEEATNLLVNGDLTNWDPTNKTIDGWEFTNADWMHKLDFVELDGRHAVKLNACTGSDKFRLEMMQKVYLEAGFTYKFSFDYYGVSHWGPNLPIYDANQQPVGTTANSGATGTEGQWTTLTNTFTPATSGYYYFAVRIHNDAYPQREQYVSNCSVNLISKGGNPRLDYELKDLKPNTDYWLTLFVKAPKVESVLDRFVTFGISDPETGDFIVMANPDSEGSRPYKVGQQLVPMAYDGQWHLISVPFNTGDATWLNFTITGSNCEVWFDNIYIFEAQYAKSYVAPETEKEEATVTDETPDKLGVDEENNLFSNFDLNDGNAFWGSQVHKYGVFGNALNIADSGSRIYGNALHYAGKKIPTGTYYIKWIDVEPNTEYTFSAKYSITQIGDGFVGLINGYRLDSDVTENRLFPTIIAEFGFGAEEYLETQEWQTIAVSFNSGERNRIGFVVCDAGGEAYIDELRLFKSSDGIELKDAADTFPSKLETVGQMVTVSDGVVYGIPAGTTLESLLKHFANSEYIRVFDADNVEITALNAVIGTGASIKLMDGPVIKDEASVLVVGDVNGDASVDAADSAAILDHISGKKSIEGIYLAAADVDADGTITVSDVLLNTKAPGSGKTTILAVGPTEFAQRAEIKVTLSATAGLQALSGKLTPTDGLTFVKAEASADGWSLSSKRSGKDVFFAAASEKGNAAAETVLITFTFRVGMISTYDEAQVNFTELLGFDGTDLKAAPDLNWVRKAPTVEEPEPEEPVIVPAKNRLSKLELVGITLSPAFDPEVKEYTATVPFEIDEVTLVAEAADEGATLEISDLKLEYVGRNTVAVRVTSADGLRRTYRIIITRQPPTQQPVPDATAPVTTAPVPTVPETTVPATVAPTVPVPTTPRPTEPVTTEPDDGITEITIRVQVPEGWENPTVWAWNNAGENAFDVWPGLALTKGADGYWYATIPEWVENVIIAANGGTVQTADLALEQTKSDVTVTVSKADDGSFKVDMEYAPVEIPTPETTVPETTEPATTEPETTVPTTNVPATTEPGDAEPDGPSVVGIVLISIAGAALLAALIILLLYFRKKRNTTAQ